MSQLEEFRALGLSEDILAALSKKGFETPSAIQSLTIPHLLGTDKDIIAQAQTGTGKTAAFGLPIIQMLTASLIFYQSILNTAMKASCSTSTYHTCRMRFFVHFFIPSTDLP